MLTLAWIWLAVGCDAPEPPPPAAPEPPPAEVVPPPVQRGLGRLDDPARIDSIALPPDNAPPGRVPGVTPLRGAFVAVAGGGAGTDVYRIGLPFSPFLLLEGRAGRRVGAYAPPGLSLTGPEGRLPFSERPRPGTWGWTADALEVRVPAGSPAPEGRRYKVSFDALAAADRALAPSSQPGAPAVYATTRVDVGNQSAEGLYLPAPGRVSWAIDVPEGAFFDAGVLLLASPVVGTGSDGATAVLELDAEERPTRELARVEADRVEGVLRADLSAWAGQRVMLTVRTDPGVTRFYDHTLLVTPQLYAPPPAPRQVVVVDVGGLSAHDRSVLTSGRGPLAAWLGQARRISAYATSPHPVDSVRSLLTGSLPDDGASRSIADRLDAPQVATAAFVAGLSLGEARPLLGGFQRWAVLPDAPADELVASASAHLSRFADRDQFVFLRLGDLDAPFDAHAREDDDVSSVVAAASGSAGAARTKALADLRQRRARAVDSVSAALGALLDGLPVAATVIVLGDHGVPLDEAGVDLAAGATLSPSTTRVPVWIRGPGIEPGEDARLASTVDLAPTVLSRFDEPGGTSWLGAPVADRTVPVGWTRHAVDAWGLAHTAGLWTTRGLQASWHAHDGDALDGAAVPEGIDPGAVLLDHLGAEGAAVWRVDLVAAPSPDELVVDVVLAGGATRAWTRRGPVDVVDGRAHLVVPGDHQLPDGLYVAGVGDGAPTVSVQRGAERIDLSVDEAHAAAHADGLSLRVSRTWMPVRTAAVDGGSGLGLR